MTNSEDDVPQSLPGFAEFSEPFTRSGRPHLLWGEGHGRWAVRRFNVDDSMDEIGHLVLMEDANYGYVDRGDGRDQAAKSPDWRELVRLYT